MYRPWRVTILAIWMTGSSCASGKIPFRPAHSISKLRMRRGAIFCHWPSGVWEMKRSQLPTNFNIHTGSQKLNAYRTESSIWQCDLFLASGANV